MVQEETAPVTYSSYHSASSEYIPNFSPMDYATSDAEALDLTLALALSLSNHSPISPEDETEDEAEDDHSESADDGDVDTSDAASELSHSLHSFTSVSTLTVSEFETIEYEEDWVDLGSDG